MTTPLSFFVREPDGLSLLSGPPFNGEPAAQIPKIPCVSAVFSSDGTMLAVTSEKGVTIYDTREGSVIQSVNVAGVKAAAFSPKGTFLQTFEPPTQAQKNVTLWNVASGAVVFQQSQKTFSKEVWPIIQFSNDESVACRTVTNEVHFFDPMDFAKGIVERLRLPGVSTARLAASPATHVAAYVPEMKGSPASVKIYERRKMSQGDEVARRSFYKSSSAQLLWNIGSTGLLVLAQSDVDKSNQSYYGEARLHYLRSDGSYEGLVPLSKDGPVHDVQWSPTGREFLAVYGFMPSRATLYDDRCRVIHNFKSGPYNTIRWNPHGRFFCLAGFGTLPGDMAFWDRTDLSCLGSTRAECTVTCEWSSDGRYILAATTAPRLRVDNGIKIFKYNGSLYYEKKYDKLFQAEWRPAAVGFYEDRPASPQVSGEKNKEKGGKTELLTEKSAAAAKTTAYMAPHAKAAAAVRAQLLGEETSSSAVSKSALKNKKRREKQKEKKDAEDATVALTEDISTLGNQMGALSATVDSNTGNITGDETTKRLRALYKKIRQIEEIKQKVSDGDGNYSTNPAQREKLQQESAIREEIRALEAQN
ncbi:hypothetical protein KP509_01G018900 [Ceratopteris richardii]|uniref:Eukaryotic translation initiation factor 2A n=1 Tax=Ceratopteris richardii TaxID=49495 RepID=A0A8T2VEK9_CERRI|nr:hypothetical protein KP509_01G018900 [Ceratopteris richardii]